MKLVYIISSDYPSIPSKRRGSGGGGRAKEKSQPFRHESCPLQQKEGVVSRLRLRTRRREPSKLYTESHRFTQTYILHSFLLLSLLLSLLLIFLSVSLSFLELTDQGGPVSEGLRVDSGLDREVTPSHFKWG